MNLTKYTPYLLGGLTRGLNWGLLASILGFVGAHFESVACRKAGLGFPRQPEVLRKDQWGTSYHGDMGPNKQKSFLCFRCVRLVPLTYGSCFPKQVLRKIVIEHNVAVHCRYYWKLHQGCNIELCVQMFVYSKCVLY